MPTNERVNQSELPLYTLKEALRIPAAIHDQYAGKPTPPIDVAMAVGIKPSSSVWRYLTGAAAGYGVVEGASNSSQITLTQLGRRAVAPLIEGDDRAAIREAALRPRVLREFFVKYDGNKFPRQDIAKNVLQSQFGVPTKRLDSTLQIIIANGEQVGFYRTIGGDRYVALSDTGARSQELASTNTSITDINDDPDDAEDAIESPFLDSFVSPSTPPPNRSVFISHSRNRGVLEQVKQLLELGEFQPEVAVEQETGAIPVPDKVFDAMRRCSAAIICVTADKGQETADGIFTVNPNVLIEIGAAYVLYDRRLILLWDKRVAVPSNLQGLYRCEFEGDELTWTAGTKIQKALLEFKRGNAPTSAT